MFAAAFAAAIWRAWPDFQPLQIGAAGALTAFYIAMEWMEMRGVHSAFMAAAGAILFISLLEESHSLAFRDTLTGLPGRRALEERLRSLGGRYTIAMVDIDHFKNFNDQHGHDVGDQVLKLVAARLAEVGGGGRAYRYGGEEFSVLFRGRRSTRRCRISRPRAAPSRNTAWRSARPTGRRTPRTARAAAATAAPASSSRSPSQSARAARADGAAPLASIEGRRPSPLPRQAVRPQPRHHVIRGQGANSRKAEFAP